MRWRRRPDTLYRRVPDGVLVISLRGGGPVWLPSPGDAVWAELADATTLDVLVEHLSEAYGAAPDVIRADCEALLGDLDAQELVEVVAP